MQLGNHLGNVLVTISDRKKGIADPLNAALIKFFEPVMLSGTDYYPFGMAMRVGGDNKYKYGFNGKENDNEVKGGDGLQQDYGMRVYDNRLGRFLSVDPITKEYPELTPYQFASNTPIMAIDIDGLEGGWYLDSEKDRLKREGKELIKKTTWEYLVASSNRPSVVTSDLYGNTVIGSPQFVNRKINIQQYEYNEAVGENIKGGVLGATGYLLAGDKGSFVGAAFDQTMFGVTGLPSKNTILSKPEKPDVTSGVANTGRTNTPRATFPAHQVDMLNPVTYQSNTEYWVSMKMVPDEMIARYNKLNKIARPYLNIPRQENLMLRILMHL